MPRLTEDQVRAGLLHADSDVRFAALHYFADCHSPNTTVMPAVIEALERFGRIRAFHYSFSIAALAQTEPTIRWAVEELKTQPRRTEEERQYLRNVSRLLCRSDPRLVQPCAEDVLASAGFDPEHREDLSRRLRLLTWDGEALWRELEAICEEGKTKLYAGEMRWREAGDIVETLGRQGPQHAGRMMDLLRQKVENYKDNPMAWMEPLMVKLAGELHHEPAIPLLVAKLHEDAEVQSEECQTALAKIGGDDVVRAVRQDYPGGEFHFRLYASGVLGRVHTDLAVQALTELLPLEEDFDLQDWLAQALVGQFSTEGNEAAHKLMLDNPDLQTLRDHLLVACTLMGQEFPELEQWRKEAQEKKRSKPLFSNSPAPAPAPARSLPAPRPTVPLQRTEKKVGRNDPCPCGSGKKFKKCCMNKRPLL